MTLTQLVGLKLVLVLSALSILLGCGGPSAVPTPKFDPEGAAAKALELHDANGDGSIDSEELESAPALKAALKTLDADKDGKVSEGEIVDRVEAWDRSQIGATLFDCTVLLNGQPLDGAKVTFEPAEFLGDVVKEAVSTTNIMGRASPKIPKEKRPTSDFPPGMQAGVYVVRVSKTVDGKEVIPAKYNTESILGQEVAKDDWAINNKQVRFELKSK